MSSSSSRESLSLTADRDRDLSLMSWRRVTAYFIDYVVVFGITLAAMVVADHQAGTTFLANSGGRHDVGAILKQHTWIVLAIWVVYGSAAEAWRGATLGNALRGLKVVSADGGPLGLGQIVLRNVGKLFALFSLLVGRSLHDGWARTRVIDA